MTKAEVTFEDLKNYMDSGETDENLRIRILDAMENDNFADTVHLDHLICEFDSDPYMLYQGDDGSLIDVKHDCKNLEFYESAEAFVAVHDWAKIDEDGSIVEDEDCYE